MAEYKKCSINAFQLHAIRKGFFFFFTHREISASVMKSVATLKMKFKKGADSMLPPPPRGIYISELDNT